MCKFRPHGFGLQNNTPKMAFLAILGSRKGLFGGLNGALVVIHLKWCITTNLGPLLGDFERKKCEKCAKNGKEVNLHTSFWPHLG